MNTVPKIPIALVGLNFGRSVIRTELILGEGARHFDLVAICDMDERRLSTSAAEYSGAFPGLRTCADLDELLADPAIPAIGLYTKPEGRAALLRKIIRAGKDVITTKPLELDADAALDVLREARKLGRVIHANSPAPALPPDLAQIVAWRDQHDLGQLVGSRIDVWAGYNEQADGSWCDDPEKCPVAPIFRLGIYLLNDLAALFGPAQAVHVFSSRISTGRPTPDNAQLSIRFQNGGLANVYASFCVNDGDHYRNSATFNFQRGTAYRNVGPHRTTQGDGHSELSLVIREKGERKLVEETVRPASGGYRWDLFAQAVRGEPIAEPLLAPEQLVDGLRLIRAMQESYRTGQTAWLETAAPEEAPETTPEIAPAILTEAAPEEAALLAV